MKAQTKELKIADLIPLESNPRTIQDDKRDALQGNIERFGMIENIVVNGRTNHILGGHQRVEILKGMGEKKVLCRVVDVDEEAEMEICIALNRIEGKWDDAKLKAIIEDLIDGELLDISGFNELEAEMILVGEDAVYSKVFDNESQADKFVKFNFGDISVKYSKQEYKMIKDILESKGGETAIKGIING